MTDSMDIYFHDVGQGDCTHLEVGQDGSANQEIYLVDFGYKKRTFNGDSPPDQTLQVLVERISEISKKRGKADPYVDHLFITHPDEDHWNYLSRLVDGLDKDGNDLWRAAGWPKGHTELKIGTLTFGADDSEYKSGNRMTNWETIVDAAENITTLADQEHAKQNKQGNVAPTWAGLGGKLKIYLISSNYPCKERGAANPKSLALIFEFDNFKAMLLGDAEPETIGDKLMEWYPYNNHSFLQCDVLKLAHHGSRKGTPPDWPRLVKPKWAFVSADYFWSHPYCEAVNNVKKANTLAINAPKHWGTCYHDQGKDYLSAPGTLGMFSTLWYVVTAAAGVTADDATGVSHRCAKGMFTGVTWLIEKVEGDANPHISWSPENVWPGPNSTPV